MKNIQRHITRSFEGLYSYVALLEFHKYPLGQNKKRSKTIPTETWGGGALMNINACFVSTLSQYVCI